MKSPSFNFLCRLEWFAAICISGVIAWFHLFYWTHVGGVWRDEVNLLNVANHHSIGDMAKDSCPVLMPLLVHGWLALGFGKTDLGLRVLGLLIGLGILSALWMTAWKTHRSPPLLGLALFALNSTLIAFGDSIRAYGLGCLLIVLTAASACAFLKKNSWARAGQLALFAVLSVQALYHNAILVGAICAGALAVCARHKNWPAAAKVFLAGALAAVSLLPYVPNLISGRDAAVVLRVGFTPSALFGKFAEGMGFPYWQFLYVWIFIALLIIARALIALRPIKKISVPDEQIRTDDLFLFAGITAPAAAIAFCIFLWCAAISAQSWYLLPLMALIVVCFDISLALQKKFRAALFVFAIMTALLSIPITSREVNYRLTNMNLRVAQLMSHASPGDYIIVLPWFCGISFEHYFHGTTPWTTLPPVTDHATHRYDLVKIQLQDTNAIVPIFQQMDAALQSGHRVWILAAEGWMDFPDLRTPPPASLPPAPLNFSGWSEMPYTRVWISQIKYFLGEHSFDFVRVKNPTGNLRVAEQMELFMVSGWKTNAAP